MAQIDNIFEQIDEQIDADKAHKYWKDNQKLIIAIDGLNCINRNSQPPGTNLFYLLYKTQTKLDFTFYFNGSMGAVIPQQTFTPQPDAIVFQLSF